MDDFCVECKVWYYSGWIGKYRRTFIVSMFRLIAGFVFLIGDVFYCIIYLFWFGVICAHLFMALVWWYISAMFSHQANTEWTLNQTISMTHKSLWPGGTTPQDRINKFAFAALAPTLSNQTSSSKYLNKTKSHIHTNTYMVHQHRQHIYIYITLLQSLGEHFPGNKHTNTQQARGSTFCCMRKRPPPPQRRTRRMRQNPSGPPHCPLKRRRCPG